MDATRRPPSLLDPFVAIAVVFWWVTSGPGPAAWRSRFALCVTERREYVVRPVITR